MANVTGISDHEVLVRLMNEITSLHTQVDDLHLALEEQGALDSDKELSINMTWTLFCTSLVMLMQLGFSLVESGSVRNSSFRHVFLKNLLDFVLGISFWWGIGYWIAFPDKYEDIFSEKKFEIFATPEEAAGFSFQAMFATTSCTIISGAMAERTRMEAYLIFVILMTSVAYSVIVRWTWGGGWLSQREPPFHDFAGSGVVHATGGVAAFVGAWLVGPRIGRFYQDPGVLRVPKPFAARSVDAIVMGTFILWFGWFGFNPGSVGTIAGGNAGTAAKAFVNTMIAPAFAAITVVFHDLGYAIFHTFRYGKRPHNETPPKFDICMVSNGVLAGLVAITAGCDAMTSTSSAAVGVVSAFILLSVQKGLGNIKIDDPVGAIAVHGANGIWGVISVGLFHETVGVFISGETDLLVTQIIGSLAIIAYIGATSGVYFYLVFAFGLLRVSKLVEVHGVDFEEFGEGEEVDVTALNLELQSEYSSSLLSSISGDGEDCPNLDIEKRKAYAQMHKRVTTVLLACAIAYNFFYYPYFQWRGWVFYSFVSTAVGLQSAAAAHAEFKTGIGNLKAAKMCVACIVFVGIGLSISNFLMSPSENLGVAYLETMSMAWFWAIWMQLRLQPLDWYMVTSMHAEAQRNRPNLDASHIVWFRALSEVSSTETASCVGWLWRFAFNSGRVQHVLEIAIVYASLIADLWVGLAAFQEAEDMTAIMLLALVVLQTPGTIGKLLEATKYRSKRLVILLCINTWISKGPILAIMFMSDSTSTIRIISIAFNIFSLVFQVANVIVAFCRAKRGEQIGSPRYGNRQPSSPTKIPKSKEMDSGELRSETPGTHNVSSVTTTSSGTKKSHDVRDQPSKERVHDVSQDSDHMSTSTPGAQEVPMPTLSFEGAPKLRKEFSKSNTESESSFKTSSTEATKKKKACDTSDDNDMTPLSQEKMASPRELAIEVEPGKVTTARELTAEADGEGPPDTKLTGPSPNRKSSRDRGKPVARSKSPSDGQQQSPASCYTNGGFPGGTPLPPPPVSPTSLTPGGGNGQQFVCNPYYMQYQQQLLGWLQHQQKLQQKQQKKAQKQKEKEEHEQQLQQQKKQQEYRQQQLLQLQKQQEDLAQLVKQDSKLIQQDLKPSLSLSSSKLEL